MEAGKGLAFPPAFDELSRTTEFEENGHQLLFDCQGYGCPSVTAISPRLIALTSLEWSASVWLPSASAQSARASRSTSDRPQ